ncbi:DUF1775 domain-containing protein [Baekduia sp. Peel2402]|uniref:DUF1775 domain-containing protein n=1 Tax=Baekduia sp. Peel2402 TaxID=3458296 RepID=UPI00403E718C
MILRRTLGVLVAAVAALAATAGPAFAHIQISPGVVAPGDSAKFTVLIPGESEAETTKVELKVPSGVLPFSYENTPGWKRTLVTASNGSVDRIVWTGRLPHDGFAEFSFLAGMPEQPGTLSWKALQTYSDGKVVRWIGTPDADHPAPTTTIEKDAARQNAGGESAAAGGGTATTAKSTADTADAAPTAPATVGDEGSDADWVARGLAIAALLAVAAAAFALGRRTTKTTST